MADWHLKTSDDVLEELRCDGAAGLDPAEAARRLADVGPNELEERSGRRPLEILWEQLTATMVLVLVVAAVASAVLGKWQEAAAILAIVLLFAVLVVGHEVAGQRNWIEIAGPFRLQPSEIAKLALVVWGATLISRRSDRVDSWRALLVPFLPVAVLMMGLVLAEGDFGNALMLAAITMGILFAAGAPMRLFAIMFGVGAAAIVMLSLAAPYRMARFTSWLNPGDDPLGFGWQVTQGQYALGTGGWWGVGLGASREKWGTLPEAHTDFIFAVVGEELGLVGTITVLVLFGLLAFAIFRMARSAQDSFVRLAAAGVGAWIVVQAVVNVGAVLGVLPITGVPLPLVSYGGSSLVPTLVALGMLMGLAKSEPDARRALRRRSTAQSLRRR